MFYSFVYNVQGAVSAKQVLAFASLRAKKEFEYQIQDDGKFPSTPENFNEGALKGVFVKLRAQQVDSAEWVPVILCADDSVIHISKNSYVKYSDALDFAKLILKTL